MVHLVFWNIVDRISISHDISLSETHCKGWKLVIRVMLLVIVIGNDHLVFLMIILSF